MADQNADPNAAAHPPADPAPLAPAHPPVPHEPVVVNIPAAAALTVPVSPPVPPPAPAVAPAPEPALVVRPSAPVDGGGPDAGLPPPPPQHDGLAQILARQWPVVATAAALAVLVAVVYLIAAPRTYTASAKLRVTPVNPQALTGDGGRGGDQQPEDYLDTECVVIKSDAVLAIALDAVRDARTFRGAARPIDVLRAGIDATVAKRGKVIEVTFPSRYPDDASRIVGAVVDAYRAYNANYWRDQSKTMLAALETGLTGQGTRIAELEARQQAIMEATGSALSADPDHSPAHLQVQSLREAKNRLELDAIAARTAYQEAAKSINGNPAQVAAVEQRLRLPMFSADPQAALRKVQDELQVQQARLTDARTQFLSNHPVIRQLQAHVDQLTVEAVVTAKQWQESAEGNLRAIARSLADAQRTELEAVQTQLEYTRIQSQIAALRTQQNTVTKHMEDTELASRAGAVNVSVLSDALADTQHPAPRPLKTMAVALVAGLLGGAALGCARDWSDDRFRTLEAIRQAAGAPILGAIPAIPMSVAATAADRGQVVQFDPFGDASESYRTLRTALQFGMPARTKTLLITSPVAGDGKSTLVSNLAIALAQANRRVLVVDADLRAPVQHRLFGLDDHIGLAGVLDGSESLDEAIQRTSVERLDVLPAGPIPSNPAEMINAPSFNDYLNDLADRYDLVLIDSPPVTAVTDARIVAAHADASLLVVRLGASTRRQTEAARDALRGVGARLIGVAVNGVGRRGSLASATGYYGRSDPPAAALPEASAHLAMIPGPQDPLSAAVRSAPPAARR